MPLRQSDTQGLYAGMAKLNTEAVCGPLAAAVSIGVEADVSEPVGRLAKFQQLLLVEMRSQSRERIGKSGLP